jgi:hypothetical protein
MSSTMSRIRKEDGSSVGVKDAIFCLYAGLFRSPDVLKQNKSPSYLAILCCDISVCALLLVDYTSQVDKDSTSLMESPQTVIGVLAVVLIFSSSVVFLFILSPVPGDVVSRRVVLSCCATGIKE